MTDLQNSFNFEDDDHDGAARRSDPDTSHEAAQSVETARLYTIVLRTLAEARTGLTTHEIAYHSRTAWGSITPRMKKLVAKDLIYKTGEKRIWTGSAGNPRSNSKSSVYQLTRFKPADPEAS